MRNLTRVISQEPPSALRERVSVRINLGAYGVRTLIYDAEAMGWLKKTTKRNPLRGEFTPGTVTDVVNFLYACTLSKQGAEGKLTPQQMADSISITQFKEAFGVVLRLMTNRTESIDQLAPYVPTHPKVVAAALALGKLKDGEIFLDLGCGDGRALAMAHKRGASFVYGYELDENRAMVAQKLVETVGASGGVFRESIATPVWVNHGANLIFTYLLGDAMVLLRPMLAELPVGTRVVSHDFTVEGWEPKSTIEVMADDREAPHKLHLYVIGQHEARNFDFSKPLSQDDASYIAEEMAKALAEMDAQGE